MKSTALLILLITLSLQACGSSRGFRVNTSDSPISEDGELFKYDKLDHAVRSTASNLVLKHLILQQCTNGGSFDARSRAFLYTLAFDFTWELYDGFSPKSDGFSVYDLLAGTLANLIVLELNF